MKKDFSLAFLYPDMQILEKGLEHTWDDMHKFGSETYYRDYTYGSYMHNPASILEVGVKYGYSACAMINGSLMQEDKEIKYVGIDHQYFPNSNVKAEALIKKHFNKVDVTLLNLNLLEVEGKIPGVHGMFDLIHQDAAHTVDGVVHDLCILWPYLKPGGLLVVDDCNYDLPAQGVDAFLHVIKDVRSVDHIINERGQKYIQKDIR